jgi:hypothetical protein
MMRFSHIVRSLTCLFLCSLFSSEAPSQDLRTQGNSFTSNSHYVSTTFFYWNTAASGQMDGIWQPLGGRSSWTGQPDYWKGEIKQMMAANIDVIQPFMVPQWACGDQPLVNFFTAYNQLRTQGYNVPKVAPFQTACGDLGWTPGAYGQTIDVGTQYGKDLFVNQYNYFYQQYYASNTDQYADSYIAQIDGRVLLSTTDIVSSPAWPYGVTNAGALTRSDIQTRLTAALGANHPLFADLANRPNNGVYVSGSLGYALPIADEELVQYQGYAPYENNGGVHGRWTATVMPGFWQPAVPEWPVLDRNGGDTYRGGLASVNALQSQHDVKHVYVQSWNEYNEGSGIFAANPVPRIPDGLTHTDTWSNTNDPYEYIKTTAEFARNFNDTPDLDATILYTNLPTHMNPGQSGTYQVIVRNDGDLSWSAAAGFSFSEMGDQAMFSSERSLIDDSQNEIPAYGGIFRGRPITFDVTITAPATAGEYTMNWSMQMDGVGRFGEILAVNVMVPEPSSLAMMAIGTVSLLAIGGLRRARKLESAERSGA